MKVAVILLSILSLSFSAPQPRKIFHENAEDFLDLIMEEAGQDINNIFDEYIEFDEFRKSLDYMRTSQFRDLIYEMEHLPEFKAVTDFLENDNIDVWYFIERVNGIIDEIAFDEMKAARQTISGKDMTSYINDCIAIFPKDKLTALYEEKVAEDEEFAVAMDNLQSDEWDQIWNALWESETFLEEAKTLLDNGIDLQVLLQELKAVFGQF